MKGILRYLLIAVGILIVVLIGIPFFVSPNQFRPTIEEKLSSALGRSVKVGNMSLSLFSGALSAEDLSIADDPAFSKSPFLTAKSLKVGVEMGPLIFSRSLRVTGIRIDKPEIVLLRNEEGKWNFSTLSSGSSSAGSSKTSSSSSSDLVVQKLELTNGRLTVGSTANTKRSVYEDVNVEATNVSQTTQFPVNVTAKLPGGGKLKLDGKVGPLDQADAALSPLDAKVDIDGMNLGSTGFLDASAGLGGMMDLATTVKSNQGDAKAVGTVKLPKLQAARNGTPSTVPINLDFDTNYDLRKSAGVLNHGTLKIGSAVAHLAGTFVSRGESTVLNMKVNGEGMSVQDLQAILPAVGVILPKGSSLQGGTMSLNLTATGPADKLVTAGNVGLFNTKLAGFDLGSKMSAISALSGAKTGSDTTIEKLTSTLRVAPEGINAQTLDLVVPALGSVTGSGTVSSSNQLNLKMLATLSGQGGAAGAIGGLLGKQVSGNAKIPFFIQGTTSDPKFVPDTAGIAGSMVQGQLGGLLGGKSGNDKTKSLGEALGGLFGKKKKN